MPFRPIEASSRSKRALSIALTIRGRSRASQSRRRRTGVSPRRRVPRQQRRETVRHVQGKGDLSPRLQTRVCKSCTLIEQGDSNRLTTSLVAWRASGVFECRPITAESVIFLRLVGVSSFQSSNRRSPSPRLQPIATRVFTDLRRAFISEVANFSRKRSELDASLIQGGGQVSSGQGGRRATLLRGRDVAGRDDLRLNA